MDERLFFLFPLFFAGMWMAVSFLIAEVGGWRLLASKYADRAGEFVGRRRYMRSGTMRGIANYNNVLTIGVDPRGLYLAVMVLFRVGHRPLYVPWERITLTERKGWIFSYVVFGFKDVPSVELRLGKKLGVEIAEAAGQRRSLQ